MFPEQTAWDEEISIHALREEGDGNIRHKQNNLSISIHALREEGDLLRGRSIRGTCAFLSTPSARRATVPCRLLWEHWEFLSTPSARRATYRWLPMLADAPISIHALREEGDAIVRSMFCCPSYFYPRPPRGGRLPRMHSCPAVLVFLSTPSARRATPF